MSTFKMCSQPCHTWCAKNNNNNYVLRYLSQKTASFTGFVNLIGVSSCEDQIPRAGLRADHAYVYLFCVVVVTLVPITYNSYRLSVTICRPWGIF